MPYQRIAKLEDFCRVVVLGKTSETRHLEFKETYGWRGRKREEQAEEAARDVVQFANAEGGALVVGVSWTCGPDGRKVADRVVTVENVDGLTEWIEQAIRNHLDPATFTHLIVPIDTGKGTVLLVNVEPCLHLVALWHRSRSRGIEYLYRTDFGKSWMNPGEVERHLMNSSRAMQLKLADVFAAVGDQNPVDVTPLVHEMSRLMVGFPAGPEHPPIPTSKARVYWRKPTEHGISLTVRGVGEGSPCVTLPTGLVREAWVTSDNRAGLCLGVKIIVGDDGGFFLDPI